jgi:hypothetical protein
MYTINKFKSNAIVFYEDSWVTYYKDSLEIELPTIREIIEDLNCSREEAKDILRSLQIWIG